jgi:hypothetical protein
MLTARDGSLPPEPLLLKRLILVTGEITFVLKGRAIRPCRGGEAEARRRETLERYGALLDAMSPMQVLGRGYSITIRQATGRAVRDPEELESGEAIRTLLAKGEVVSTVTSVNQMREGRPCPAGKKKKKGSRG